MEQISLTPRRKLKTSSTFEPAINEFMKMKIDLDKIDTTANNKCDFSPKKKMTIRERSLATTREYQSDKILDARRRAFDVAFERKAKRAKTQLEREWSENERMRDWRNKAQQRNLPQPKKRKRVDKQVIEQIIQDRNEYYLASSKDSGVPPKPSLMHTRALPRDVRATSMYSARRPDSKASSRYGFYY